VELSARAHQWWAAEGVHAEALVASKPEVSPERAEAIAVVKGLVGARHEEIAAVVAAYGSERFQDRDKAWWVRTILDELERDRQREVVEQTQEFAIRDVQAKTRKAKRELVEQKSRAAVKRQTRPRKTG
jgi:hypothetical protein